MENTKMAEKKKKSHGSNVVFAIIVIVFLVIVLGLVSIDGILKTAIEKAITKQLNVKASLSKVSLNLASGTLTVSNLKIANPQGYKSENILELKSLVVKTSIGSLLSNPAEIKQIALDDLAVVIEQKGLTSNLNDIVKSMPAKEAKTAEPPQNQKSVHISSVDINNISVTAKLLPLPGKSGDLNFNISSLHMSDIGGEKTTLAEAVGKIFAAITKEIAAKGTDILPSDMLGPIQENLGKSFESVGETGKQLIEKTGEDAAKTLKGLFEKKKN